MPEDSVTLESFVPEFVIDCLAAGDGGSIEEQIEGAAMFIDVVGFTGMTEAASLHDRAGAEQVSSRLRLAFGDLDDLVDGSGGAIVDFVGDAILAVWRADDHGNVRGAARAAVACANTIQERVAGGSEPDRLKFRIAVGAGEIWLVSAGGYGGSWIPIAGGAAVAQVAEAMQDAAPGGVTLSPETAELLQIENRTEVRRIVMGRSPLPRRAGVHSHLEPAVVAPYVPDIVRARYDAGLLESFAEYRKVTTAFTRLIVAGPDGIEGAGRIRSLTETFQQVVAEFGGSVVNVLVDDRGLIGIAIWGAALHTHDDDALRAIRAMRTLHARAGGEVPTGIGSGDVFFGDIGSSRHRQYAVVGTAVNRTARLMEASDGRILTDDETVRLLRRRMAFEEQPAKMLKGLQGRTRMFTPMAEIHADLPGRRSLIGRADEVAQLTFELETAIKGDSNGRLLIIEGEAGIGKSRLVADLLDSSQRYAARAVIVRGSELGSSTPYQAWTPAIIELLGGTEAAHDRLIEFFPDAPHRRQLVEIILELAPPEGERSRSNPDASRDALAAVVRELLRNTPTLLVVEDAHWLDPPSWELLNSVLNIPGTLIAMTMRPEAEARLAQQALLAQAHNSSVIQLGPLAASETAALVCQRLDVTSLPGELAEAIYERTEGHPLFTEELTLAVRDEGLIDVDAEGHVSGLAHALQNLAYPASVHSTVASRIDQLPLAEQLSLRVASVVGREFDLPTVAAVHTAGLTEDELRSQLADIERHQLIERVDSDRFVFKHAIIGDVAYGTVPDSDRVGLHRRVAGSMEAGAGGKPSAADPAIARHWQDAGDIDKAVAALDRSADYAIGIASYREAVAFLERAQGLDNATASRLGRARRSTAMGMAYRALGDLPSSQAMLREAAAGLGEPMPRTRPGLWIGAAAQVIRQLAHRIAPPLFTSRRTAERARIEQVAAIYFAMTTTTFASQDAPAFLYVGLKATNEAERIPSTAVLARGYSFLTFATGTAGLKTACDRYFRRGLDAAAEAGDAGADAEVVFNRAVLLTAMGEWGRAGEQTDQAIAAFDGLNHHYESLNADAVRTYQLLQQGRWDEASARYQLHKKEAEELDEALHLVWSLVWGDSIGLRQGELDRAATGLAEAGPVTDEVGETASQIARLGYLSMALWWEGKPREALDNAHAALDLMKRSEWLSAPHAYDGFLATARVWLDAWEKALAEGDSAAGELQRSGRRACLALRRLAGGVAMARPGANYVWGRYYRLAGRTRKGTRRLEKGLGQAVRLGMPYEEALLLVELTADADRSQEERDGYRRRAGEIFEQLGAGPDLLSLGEG